MRNRILTEEERNLEIIDKIIKGMTQMNSVLEAHNEVLKDLVKRISVLEGGKK